MVTAHLHETSALSKITGFLLIFRFPPIPLGAGGRAAFGKSFSWPSRASYRGAPAPTPREVPATTVPSLQPPHPPPRITRVKHHHTRSRVGGPAGGRAPTATTALSETAHGPVFAIAHLGRAADALTRAANSQDRCARHGEQRGRTAGTNSEDAYGGTATALGWGKTCTAKRRWRAGEPSRQEGRRRTTGERLKTRTAQGMT